MDNNEEINSNVSGVENRKEKYLDLIEELEKNDLGAMTKMNPDEQLDNDEILKNAR